MYRAASAKTVEAKALLLSRVAYGEADLIVHLFTDLHGKISAMARGARRSKKRFNGALEPMHTLTVEMNEKPRGEFFTLKDATIFSPRTALTSDLDALTSAGHALSWVRRAAPQNTPEPQLWQAIHRTLDGLGQLSPHHSPDQVLGAFGLRLLEVLGWGMNLLSCVSCGKACPEDRAAWVHPERGGLMCRSCGGGPFQLSGKDRASLLRALADDGGVLDLPATAKALKIIERALSAHMGFDDRHVQAKTPLAPDLGPRFK